MSRGQGQLIAMLEQAGPDRPEVRRLVAALRRPAPRPHQLEELERLIEQVDGPDVAALVVAEALRGGLGG